MPIARNGEVEIYYESFGDPADPCLLLVNGLGSQCINYDEAWCALFVDAGFRVIRFDNREMGLSTGFEHVTVDLSQPPPYTLSDMALDAIAVLDAEGVTQAHVMGLSMGGMIVQTLAIEHPDRLLTMTSVMSSTGEAEYGQATPEAMEALIAPTPPDPDESVEASVRDLRIWGSPAFADEDRRRAFYRRAVERAFRPTSSARQFWAVRGSEPRAEKLRSVTVPTLVIHGDCDTLIDISGGRRTAELIPGARFVAIEGMGHDYPPELWPQWVALVADHALGR